MSTLLENNEWLSLDEVAEPLALLLGKKALTSDGVLAEMTGNRLAASVLITSVPLLVWPLVVLTGQDAEQFKLDEQRTETYRGKSFTIKGEFLAPYRENTLLQGGRVLDLPLSTDTRNFLQHQQDNPVPTGKRLCLPRGTLVQIPGTGQYFVTVDILEVPDVFCEIVVRTNSLRELERQLNARKPERPAQPVVAVSNKKKWTLEKLAELKTYRDANTMPETVKKFSITEQRIRQLLPSENPKVKPFAGLVHRTK